MKIILNADAPKVNLNMLITAYLAGTEVLINTADLPDLVRFCGMMKIIVETLFKSGVGRLEVVAAQVVMFTEIYQQLELLLPQDGAT